MSFKTYASAFNLVIFQYILHKIVWNIMEYITVTVVRTWTAKTPFPLSSFRILPPVWLRYSIQCMRIISPLPDWFPVFQISLVCTNFHGFTLKTRDLLAELSEDFVLQEKTLKLLLQSKVVTSLSFVFQTFHFLNCYETIKLLDAYFPYLHIIALLIKRSILIINF